MLLPVGISGEEAPVLVLRLTNSMKQSWPNVLLISCCITLSGEAYSSPAIAFEVVPSRVQSPPGVPVGKFRRIYHPFENWTLICDENLQERTHLCNIRQEIAASGSGVIFTWIIAATDTGDPRIIAHGPATIQSGQAIQLRFKDDSTFRATVTCGPQSCSTTIPIGPKIREHIKNGYDIEVSFTAAPVGEVRFHAPMKGAASALMAVGE